MPKQLNPAFSSFNYFESLFKNTKQNNVLLMDANGTITEINTSFTEAFGYTDEDIIGKHTRIIFNEEDQRQGLPEKELEKVLNTGQSNDNNYLVHKNKTISWVSGESILVKNHKGETSILKVIQNIHKQKIYEQSLQQLNVFNESILDSIEDLVLVLDEKLQLIKGNPAFFELFNVQKTDPGFFNFQKIIAPFDVNNDLVKKIQRTIATGSEFCNKTLEIGAASGEKKIYEFSCKVLNKKIDQNRVLLIAHDITEQKKSERQREDTMGFVAHELRNPLANVMLCNELMNEAITENNLQDALTFLSKTKNNTARLNRMINELYDATKLGSGNFHLEVEKFSFNDMIQEAVETVEVLQPDFTIKIDCAANIEVTGDRYRLIQVVTNYLTNGVKYSKPNTAVVLKVWHDERNVTVAVKDKGPGIPKDQMQYIFNRFFRADKTKNVEGVGLGLYLCRQIITAHRGKVWAESEEGRGSTFYFSIPVTQN